MNIVTATFTDAAWYWPVKSVNADGSKTMGNPIPIMGRWVDSPSRRPGPHDENKMMGATYSSTYLMRAGGWVVLQRMVPSTIDVNTTDPRELKSAREVGTVHDLYSYDKRDVYYQAELK